MWTVLVFEVVYDRFDVFIICTYVLSNKLFKMWNKTTVRLLFYAVGR